MAFPKLEIRQTFAASTFGAAVDAGAQSYAAAADYFWETIGSGAASLRASLQTILAAVVASTVVQIVDETGIMQVTWGSGSHTLVFPSTAIANLCGFANASNGPAPSLVGTRQVKALWLPTSPAPAELEFPYGAIGKPNTDRRKTISRSGKPWFRVHSSWKTNRHRWGGLLKRKIATECETTVNESFETLWNDYLKSGYPFRFYTDRTSDTSYQVTSGAARDYYEISDEMPEFARHKGQYDDVWSIDMKLLGYS